MIKNSIITKAAQHQDIEQMMAICEQNLLTTNCQKFTAVDFSQKGFLLTRLTFENAKKMIDDEKNYFLAVAKNDDEVLGYLIACDIEKSGINLPKAVLSAQEITNSKIFYHKQIAKKLTAKGVGKKLLLAMCEQARKRGYEKIICRIVHAPFYNQASISFHQKFGFKKIGEMQENKIALGIYIKSL